MENVQQFYWFTMKFVCLLLLFGLCFAQFHKVQFQLKNGNITLNINREWAPIGVDRFLELLKEKYYNNNGIFRVVPNFVVQFGINGDPKISGKWKEQTIKDDKVLKSNLRGWVSFAASPAPHTRTTKLFINLVNNTRLDALGFSPFGYFDEKDMKLVDEIYSGYGQTPIQDLIYLRGNDYLRTSFPKLDYLYQVKLPS
jgi:peptidyl-prolyl cis-trans isomerase A (cyclophilin A)